MYAPRDPLTEFLDGDLSPRQLQVLLEHLPPYAATERSLRGRWTATEKLLEAILNEDMLQLDQNVYWQTKQERRRDPQIVLPDPAATPDATPDVDYASDFDALVLGPHRRARREITDH